MSSPPEAVHNPYTNNQSKKAAAVTPFNQQRTLGQAQSTYEGHANAIGIHDLWRTTVREDCCFADMTEQDVEADNLEHEIVEFLKWMAITEIEQNNSTGKHLSTSTKIQCAGRVKECYKKRWPKHDSWKDESWYLEWRHAFEKDSKREAFDKGTDRQDPKVRPLYRRVEARYLCATQRVDGGWRQLQGADLESINEYLIKTKTQQNNNLERRAIINNVYQGVGRGGEPKFMRYDDCVWDPYLECVDTYWRQRKTLEATPMTFTCDYDSYLCDTYHSMGCYLSIENGLHRTENQKRISKFIFPHLHSVRDSTVTTNVTKWLREACHTSLKARTSAKSLRQGANTFLAMHPQITKDERLVRGCWAPSDTSDKAAYKDINPALTLPAALALEGWPDVRARVYPMRLPINLPTDELAKLKLFHQSLYVSSLGTQFQTFLGPFLETCTASMILYHPTLLGKYGASNYIVNHMVERMVSCKAALSLKDADKKLSEWSREIEKDMRSRNREIQRATERHLLEASNQQSRELQHLSRAHKETQDLLKQYMFALEDDKNRRRLAEAQSPTRKRMSPVFAATETEETEDDEPPLPVNNKQPRLEKRTGGIRSFLNFGARADSIQQSSGTNKNIFVRDVIVTLYREGQIALHSDDMELTRYPEMQSKNRGKYRAVMRLIQQSWSADEKKRLATKGLPGGDILDLAEKVQAKCMWHMAGLEGKSELGKAKAYIAGLGNRLLKFEKSSRTKTKEPTAAPLGLLSRFMAIVSPSRKNVSN